MTAGLKESLSVEETAALLDYMTGQNSDGYGEGFEQHPIKTADSRHVESIVLLQRRNT